MLVGRRSEGLFLSLRDSVDRIDLGGQDAFPSAQGRRMNHLFALSATLALLSHPALVILFGALLLRGNSVTTGAALIVPLGLIAFSSHRPAFAVPRDDFSRYDGLFLAFATAVALSFVVNPLHAEAKEILLMGITLFAYVACRRVSAGQLECLSQAIFWGSLAISVIGFAATVPVLIADWDSLHRPAVFGFSHAATLFAGAAGLLAISSATTRLPRTWMFFASSLVLACSVAVFAACFVRFVFVAIVVALIVGVLVSRGGMRRKFLINAGIVCFAIALGSAANHSKTTILASYTVNVVGSVIQAGATIKSGCDVDRDNSVALRRKLIEEFIEATPRYGLVGFGLDSFQSSSCLAMPPHNSLLQAFYEFGFLGGASLLVLLGAVLAQLFKLARVDQRTVIVLSSLVLFAALDMAYGRLSRDIQTFALIGMSVALIQQARQRAASPGLNKSGLTALRAAGRSIAAIPSTLRPTQVARPNELQIPTPAAEKSVSLQAGAQH